MSNEHTTKTISGMDSVNTTVLGADEIILNMGPQHPSTHGVLRVKLKLDGERVAESECIIGYLHRGVEKIAEHRSYQQFAPYVDRMDYVAAVSNGLGYCEAVEKLLGTEAPPRARLTTHAFRIGGLQYETYDGFEEDTKRFCNDFSKKIDESETLLTENRIWVGRTKGVGILNAAGAIARGVTGPAPRAR